MRIGLALAGIALGALAQGQSTLEVEGRKVTLGPPTAVAVGVKDVNWAPSGKALMYDAVDADGYYQGFYRTTDEKAKSVMRIPQGAEFQHWKWLPNRLAVIEVLKREIPDKGTVRWTAHLLDAQRFTARELRSWEYPKDSKVTSELEVSPTRDHAILTFHDEKGVHPFVLLDGGAELVPSADVAAAHAAGASFAGWSVEGTAYYSDVPNLKLDGATVQVDGRAQGAVQFIIQAQAVGEDARAIHLTGSLMLVAANKRAPDAGTPVLELMPWNAGLRQVRSKGPNIETAPTPAVQAESQPAQVLAAERKGRAGSLWMVPALDEFKRVSGSLLIAAEAEKSWFDPRQSFVAYETAGALFVRRIMSEH